MTPKIIADFETQLSAAIAVSDTSFTLSSATDDDGVALPAGKYYFTIENGSSNKEYLVGTLSGTTVSSVSSVSRQGAETSGAARAHRVGSSVIISDFLTYKNYMDEIALVSAPDGDTNTKGVFEAATLAEVRAGTASGSTGANLAVTPDVLDDLPTSDEKAALAGTSGTPSTSNKFVTADDVSSTGGSGKVIRTSGTDLPIEVTQATKVVYTDGITSDLADASTTETDIFSYTVPAGALGTGGGLRFTVYCYVNNLGQSLSGPTIRMKYGSTTVASKTFSNVVTPQGVNGIITGVMLNDGATGAQTGFMDIHFTTDSLDVDIAEGSATAFDVRGTSFGTASEDSTGALDFDLTLQFGAAVSNVNFDVKAVIVELIS